MKKTTKTPSTKMAKRKNGKLRNKNTHTQKS